MKKLTLLMLLAVFVLASCQKNSTPAPELKSLKIKTFGSTALCSPFTPGTDIYITDQQNLVSNPAISVAGYYKNGVFVRATTDTAYSSAAIGITVVGNDVYVTGGESGPEFKNGKAVYWKNGVAHYLNYGDLTGHQSSTAYDIAIVGSDVYVIGNYLDPDHNHNTGIIWKNGVAHSLDFGGVNTYAEGLAVNGSDVYVSGVSTKTSANNANTTATLWKNNIPQKLTCAGLSASGLFAITINGSDVYVAGTTFPAPNSTMTAVYWKNGVQHFLGSGYGAITSGITVKGGYAYVVGTQIFGADQLVTQAIYWKNNLSTFHNTQVFFGSKGGNYAYYEGRRIVIDGTDIYTTAFQYPYLYLYKNNIPTRIAASQGAYGKLLIVHH